MDTRSSAPAGDSSKVFARDATGLVREVSPLLATVFNFSNAPIGVVLVFSSIIGFGYFSGGNILLGILIAVLGSTPVLLNYAYLTSSMPRSGGDYVFVSRLLHPAIGFAANFALSLIQVLGSGAVAIFFSLIGVVPAFAVLAQITGNQGFSSVSDWAATPTGSFIIAVIVLTFLALLLARGTATALRFNSVVWGIGLVSLLLMIIVLVSTSHEQFVSRFNAFAQKDAGLADAYNATIATAKTAGFQAVGGFQALWGLIAVGMFGAGWFFWSTYISGEIKGARQLRSTVRVMLSGQLVNGALYLLGVYLFIQVFGQEFLAAVTWLLFNSPSDVPYFSGAGAQIVFFTAISTTAPWLAGLLVVTFIAWGWPLLTAYALQIQRCAFAWSFDQLVPARLSQIDRRTHTPLILIGIVWLLTVGAAAVTAYTSFIYQIYASTFLGTALFSMLVASIAAMVFPYRGREAFELSPIARMRIAGIPLITITGILGAAFTLFWGAAYFVLAPFGMQANSSILTLFLVGVFVAGLVIYYVARAIRVRQGVPMDLVFAQVPPE
jgi:APA family basic amino acid/polyamine antiporter